MSYLFIRVIYSAKIGERNAGWSLMLISFLCQFLNMFVFFLVCMPQYIMFLAVILISASCLHGYILSIGCISRFVFLLRLALHTKLNFRSYVSHASPQRGWIYTHLCDYFLFHSSLNFNLFGEYHYITHTSLSLTASVPTWLCYCSYLAISICHCLYNQCLHAVFVIIGCPMWPYIHVTILAVSMRLYVACIITNLAVISICFIFRIVVCISYE